MPLSRMNQLEAEVPVPIAIGYLRDHFAHWREGAGRSLPKCSGGCNASVQMLCKSQPKGG